MFLRHYQFYFGTVGAHDQNTSFLGSNTVIVKELHPIMESTMDLGGIDQQKEEVGKDLPCIVMQHRGLIGKDVVAVVVPTFVAVENHCT